MFVAGELEIITNFCRDKTEKIGRLKLLQKISYYSSIYQWNSILDFYGAWLRQIELGRKTWADDTQSLENVVLSGHNLSKEIRESKLKYGDKSNQSVKDQTLFCVKYHRNKCEQVKSPHPTIIRGQTRMVHHICASYLQKDKVKKVTLSVRTSVQTKSGSD